MIVSQQTGTIWYWWAAAALALHGDGHSWGPSPCKMGGPLPQGSHWLCFVLGFYVVPWHSLICESGCGKIFPLSILFILHLHYILV